MKIFKFKVCWGIITLVPVFISLLMIPADASQWYQICQGTVAERQNGEPTDDPAVLYLKDAHGFTWHEDNSKLRESLWCDANFSVNFGLGNIPKRLTEICSVGTLCIVKGRFAGRGVFYWIDIHAATRVDQ